MLIVLLVSSIIFSPIVTANEFDNIEKVDEGYLFSEDDVIELANYIEELEAENKRLKAQLEQAEKEIDTAYKNENIIDMRTISNYLTGAGIASLIILIAN